MSLVFSTTVTGRSSTVSEWMDTLKETADAFSKTWYTACSNPMVTTARESSGGGGGGGGGERKIKKINRNGNY